MLKSVFKIVLIVLFLVWIFAIYKSSNTENQSPKIEPIALATSTPTIVEIKEEATSTSTIKTATTTETKKKPQTTKIVVVKTEIITPKTEAPPEPPPDFETINNFARTAVVNVLCTAGGNTLSPISGTGVVISPNGVVLTNAHIGQYFLLRNLYQKDYIQCILRTGSPAYPRYHAELVYISPAWVEANKSILKTSSEYEKGTGENDFALLHITDRIDNSILPTALPYIPINTSENMSIGEPVILVAYPAGFLGGLTILQNLSVASAVTTIQNFFTFKTGSGDVMEVGGTVVSQNGASGGAVIDRHSNLIGIISTRSSGDTTGSRELDAITLSYINKSLQNESGISLQDLLFSDINLFADNFQNTTGVVLTKLITDELSK